MDAIGYLTTEGFIVPTQVLKKRFGVKYNDFLNKLTIVHRPKIGPPQYARMYKEINRGGIQCMCLPRTLMKILIAAKILMNIEIILPQLKPINAQLHINLFDNQKVVVEYLLGTVFTPERIAAGTATCVFNLKAGQGKTFAAGGIIASLRVRTLYIVPKRPLAVQAVKDLRACLYPDDGEPGLRIGQYGKAKKSDPDSDYTKQDITVIVINSALLRNIEFFRDYNLVVFDEVHSYCSEQRREIFKKASLNMCLGMSATTEDRLDGFDPIAHKELAFDDVIRAENIPGFAYEAVDFQTDVKVIRYKGSPEYTQSLTHESTGKLFTPYMNKQFLRDPVRLQLIVREIRSLYDWSDGDDKHCIYVFAEEIEGLRSIYREIKKTFVDVVAPEIDMVDQVGDAVVDPVVDVGDPAGDPVVDAGDVVDPADPPLQDKQNRQDEFSHNFGEFIGGIKDKTVESLKQNARVLLTTYAYSGTGVSIDKMTAMVFATPRRSNMKQILARILRRGGNKRIRRKVIDIVDDKTPIKYQYGSRLIAYEFYGMNVEVVKE